METTNTKLCSRCQKEKPLSDFSFNKKNNRYAYACKGCVSANTQQWMKKLFESTNPEDVKKANFYKMFQAIYTSARIKNIPIDIDLPFVTDLYNKQQGKCYYTGVTMRLRTNNHILRDPLLISMDRVDSKQGYIKSNVVLCCWGINSMKSWHNEEMMYNALKLFYEGAAALGKIPK